MSTSTTTSLHNNQHTHHLFCIMTPAHLLKQDILADTTKNNDQRMSSRQNKSSASNEYTKIHISKSSLWGMIWCPPDTCIRHITPPSGIASLSPDILPRYARALGKVLPSGEFWASQASNPATFGTTRLDLACVPGSSPSSNPVSSHAATSHESQEPRSSRRLDWGDGQTRDESAAPPASRSSTSAEL